jgi:hypothetical protein
VFGEVNNFFADYKIKADVLMKLQFVFSRNGIKFHRLLDFIVTFFAHINDTFLWITLPVQAPAENLLKV